MTFFSVIKDVNNNINYNLNNLNQPYVAIGFDSGKNTQGDYAIAIGNEAGKINQGYNAIAIGNESGKINQGNYSIAIGHKAGNNNQPNNSIIINADEEPILTATQSNSLYMNPIRNLSQTNVLGYDSINKEITYFTLTTSSLTVANKIALTHDVSSGNYHIPFSKTESNISNDLYINNLTYNPYTGNLTSQYFTGNLYGNSNSSNNLSGGTIGQIPYQSGTGSTSFISNGTSGQVLKSNGSSAPSWIDQSSLSVSSANTSNTSITSTTSTNLAGGSIGQIPYQSGSGSTSFVSNGTSGQVLKSNGNSVPSWVDQSSLSVGSANTSNTSTNLTGGSIGQIPYQSGTGSTSFVSNGTSGQVLKSNGNSVPSWVDQSSLSVSSANTSNTSTTSTNLAGGTIGQLPYQSGSGSTSFVSNGTSGQLLKSNGNSAPSWVDQSSLSVNSATTSSNLAGGTIGQIPYQSGTGSTSFVSNGTSGQVLKSNGNSVPSWVDQSSLSVGSSTTSTNLAGGSIGQLPYQSGSGSTSFVSNGTSGQVLKSNGNSVPSWVDQSSLSVSSAIISNTSITSTTSTNLAGGTIGQIPYQSGSGSTSFISNGTSGQVLKSNGNTIPSWVDQSSLSVGSASTSTSSTNLTGGTIGQIPYQSGVGSTSFVSNGTSGQLLKSNGNSAPSWIDQSSLTIGSSTTSTNLAGGTIGQVPYQSGIGTTSFVSNGNSGQVFKSNGNSAPSWVDQSSLSVGSATTSTNLAGGTIGQLPYQSGSGSTSFVSNGTSGQVLKSNGNSVPSWVDQSSLSVGSANTSNTSIISTTSTNLAGGTIGQIPYQSGTGSTSFISNGNSGQVFKSNGNSSPSWVDQSSLSVGSATTSNTSTNLTGGTIGQIPYQSGTGSTSFVSNGTSGQVLKSNGNSVPSWVDQSSLSVGSSNTSNTSTKSSNLAGGLAGSLPYQSSANNTNFLGIGTNGQILSVVAGTPNWINQPPASVTVTDNNNGTITISGVTIDICSLVQNYCDRAVANDDNVGFVTTSSITYDVSQNDTLCLFGPTTWKVVSTSNCNVSPITSTDGYFTISPTGANFSFTYNILCSNNVKDNALVSGISTQFSLKNTTTVNVLSGQHFTSTTYASLTDNILTRPTTGDYRLHQEGKDAGIVGWGFNNTLTGGSVQVWWSNDDGSAGTAFGSMGLIIEVGSYNGGTPIINNTTTLMGASVATDYTPSNITIPSNITWSYLQIRSVNDLIGQDPILWEVRINNIPNL